MPRLVPISSRKGDPSIALPLFLRRKPFPSQHHQPGSRRRCRLHLEQLEQRCLLTTVLNLNDAGEGSLRQAIIDAPTGGTVDFQDGLKGTITLTTGELLINKGLTIDGPGREVIAVSGGNTFRVFEIAASFTVSILGLTIADGWATGSGGGGILNAGTLTFADSTLSGNAATGTFGGGILNYGALAVTDSTLSTNFASTGGGIANLYGMLTVTGCTLSANSASTGGGIDNFGTLTVTDSTLSDNAAWEGGGIDNYGDLTVTDSTLSDNAAINFGIGGGIYNTSTATVTDSTLSDNAAGYGGAIYNTPSATLTVTGCTLSANSATSTCGGIENLYGMLTVTDSTLSTNSAGQLGGGIYNANGTLSVTGSTLSDNTATNSGFGGGIWNSGNLTVTDSTLTGNAATFTGGGIANFNGMLTVTGCTLSGNAAGYGGGGIINSDSLTVRNSIFAGNTAASSPDVAGTLFSQGHNLVGNAQGASGFDPTDLLNVDPMLGPLQDNGGPTWTMALSCGSPAIDAGDNADAPDWDQRGEGYPRIVNGVIDIGAYEVQDGECSSSMPRRVAEAMTHAFPLEVTAGLSPLASPDKFKTTLRGIDARLSSQSGSPGSGLAFADRYFASPQQEETGFALTRTKPAGRDTWNRWLLDMSDSEDPLVI
jgi:hypothetical protein